MKMDYFKDLKSRVRRTNDRKHLTPILSFNVRGVQRVPGADMGDLGRSGVPRALRKSPGVKKHGEHAGDGHGARFSRFGGWNVQNAARRFWKN